MNQQYGIRWPTGSVFSFASREAAEVSLREDVRGAGVLVVHEIEPGTPNCTEWREVEAERPRLGPGLASLQVGDGLGRRLKDDASVHIPESRQHYVIGRADRLAPGGTMVLYRRRLNDYLLLAAGNGDDPLDVLLCGGVCHDRELYSS